MRNSARYGPTWRKRSRQCRELAGNRCQKCGIIHGTPKVSIWTGRLWPVWLQAAHINHDPENESAELIAVCPACHWRYYRKPGQRAAWIALERMKHQRLIQQAYCY